MSRYVLLWHEMPLDANRASHWDFMLEREGVLWTWALEKLPSAWREQLRMPLEDEVEEVAALRLGDHRLAYLEYEGDVSGNRGSVTRVASGAFEWSQDNSQQLKATLSGDLVSSVTLTPSCEAAPEVSAAREPSWQLHAAKIAPKGG